jgi:hypothetical protein
MAKPEQPANRLATIFRAEDRIHRRSKSNQQLGGGIFDADNCALTLLRNTESGKSVTGGPSAAAGQGVGGGIYISPRGTVRADVFTVITGNHASTSDDDVFGVLCLV